MSKLGNINKTYGEQINIGIANASDLTLFSSTNLSKNTLIICAENNGGDDVGTYSLSITDMNGTPIRLTYTLERTNVLTYNNSVRLNVDNKTLISYNKLSINTNKLFDSAHISYGKLSINTNNLYKGNTYHGVIRIDNNTTKLSSTGNLYVETINVDTASNDSIGIVKGDNNTVSIVDGKISINTNNLTLCNRTAYGIVKASNTIGIKNDGTLFANIDGFSKTSYNNYGVLKVDGKTIVSKNGVLSINSNILNKASSTSYGVAKFAPAYFKNENGIISVKNYNDILNRVNIAYNALPKIYAQLTYYSNKYKNAYNLH